MRNACYNITTFTIPGTLTEVEQPGHFTQELVYGDPPQEGAPTDYNVIWLDDESAIEYDCVHVLGVTNYCIHIMSR